MTPTQLADVFAYIEGAAYRVTEVHVNRIEFTEIVSHETHQPFTPFVDPAPFSDRDPVGTIWGANVYYDLVPLRQVRVEGRSDKRPEPAPVSLVFEILESGAVDPDLGVNYPQPDRLGRRVRPLVEPVDTDAFVQQGRNCTARLKDIRDHAALDGHRAFSIQPGWVITCENGGCDRSWQFTIDDIAAAGRYDLVDQFGWGAEIESIKIMPWRERPTAWKTIGEFLDDEPRE